MLITVPRESVPGERRVGVTPDGVRRLRAAGHTVLVQSGAGEGAGFDDEEYTAAGADLTSDPRQLFERSELMCRVKQPQPPECNWLAEGSTLFCYLLLGPRPWLVDALLQRRVSAIAYEEVTLPDGVRPLLRPMSEIAGRLAVRVGAHYLARPPGSRGVLLDGLGADPGAHVLILGGGTVGASAAAAAVALGACVTVLDLDPERARRNVLAAVGRVATPVPTPRLQVAECTRETADEHLARADLVINGVQWDPLTGWHIVTRESLRTMPRGAALVDVACDPGGAVETCRVMSIEDPVFEEEGVVHYCVPNMPGTVPRTATRMLSTATLPYVERLASLGVEGALAACPELGGALVCHEGRLLDPRVAQVQGRPFSP